MKRKKVESSMIHSIGYDAKKKILELEFKTGSVWQYVDVSKNVFSRLSKAKSAGRYFLDVIKDCYEEYPVR